MFGNKKQVGVKDYSKEIADLKHSHTIQVKELESSHKLALKEKEFELRHFKDDEVKKLQSDLNKAGSEIAVLKKENEMLAKITNLNADIIDIKDLVANLINKLPEIKLNNLTISNGSDKK